MLAQRRLLPASRQIYFCLAKPYHYVFVSMSPEVSIVIPAFNESGRMSQPLGAILSYISDRKLKVEVIVVDDGSSDDTSQVAERAFAAVPDVTTRVIRYEQNRGKGFAVRTGLQAATADVGLFTDADLSTPIDEMSKLVEPIRAGQIDVAFGSRALDRTLIGTHQPWQREQGGRVMNLIIKKMSGLGFSDTQCGLRPST